MLPAASLALDPSTPSSSSTETPVSEQTLTPSETEDALVLEDGVPHYVSGKHWVWMAEDSDIKSLLNEMQTASSEPADQMLFEPAVSPASAFLPATREDCYLLLNLFLANVDPMVRIIHRPSLTRRFDVFVGCHYSTSPAPAASAGTPFDALAMAVFLAAINSIKEADVVSVFSTSKAQLMHRYQAGTEFHLSQHHFLTTRSFEVLQALVIFITAKCREDEMGEVYSLTGLAIRIAMLQGLHRDPLALRHGVAVDSVAVELRRRLWAQICHLDYRAAESHGLVPSIRDSDFDTRLPLNIDDGDLQPAPGVLLVDCPRFTDMTMYLIRITGIASFRRVVQITRDGTNGTTAQPPTLNHYRQLVVKAEQLARDLDASLSRLLPLCDERISIQAMAVHYSRRLTCKFWVMFWIQIPRQYRDHIMTAETRQRIFSDAVLTIENWCMAASATEAQGFHWQIHSHAGFFPILYVLSELRSPGFQAPDLDALRARGLQAVTSIAHMRQTSSGPWPSITRLVERVSQNTSLAVEHNPLPLPDLAMDDPFAGQLDGFDFFDFAAADLAFH
ncbi:hypothetical protein ASPZODRAFT_70406 [Penicilliopsis zonata CBS 506.65]|uniref:Xylanolytic transcriptional activator regulatory domain-containing protein n=1 Tax=Penicilliopsis zonata CBS 506.65 TaxID=1073090 RepID=A0A1L9SDF5_9EURO|nr:hypothetical protein ASPZODRAFT_70406 [Penicilliopsis zonata CBS 506.65]OJJ45143.1 hypothetical protein ASPZODRAFT_70406 [Penicilliopsis zonata CBS 506.65]